jgi:hypothetical protein
MPHRKASYLAERMPPQFSYQFDEPAQLITYTCPQSHTVTEPVNPVVTRFTKVRREGSSLCKECLVVKKLESREAELRQDCEKGGFTFLRYTPSTRMVDYLCKCGRERSGQDSTMKKRQGCKQCVQDVKKLSLSDLATEFVEAHCELLSTTYTGNKQSLEYRCVCGNVAKIILSDFRAGKRCMQCRTTRTVQTNLRRYGVENVGQREESKEKSRQTSLLKYGADHHMRNPEQVKKVEAAVLESRGTRCMLLDPEVQAKGRAAMVEKYGVAHGLQVPEVQKKIVEGRIKEWGAPYLLSSPKFRAYVEEKNLREFGVRHHQQLESWKQLYRDTFMRKYNEVHPMHVAEFFRKNVKSAFSSKPYKFPSGNEVHVMGYENVCIDILLGLKKSKYQGPFYTEDDVHVTVESIPYLDGEKKRKYYPDILVENTLIEVKSIYTFDSHIHDNCLKFEAASKVYPCFQVWIFKNATTLHDIITYQSGERKFLDGTPFEGNPINPETKDKSKNANSKDCEEIMKTHVKSYMGSETESDALSVLYEEVLIELVDEPFEVEIIFED